GYSARTVGRQSFDLGVQDDEPFQLCARRPGAAGALYAGALERALGGHLQRRQLAPKLRLQRPAAFGDLLPKIVHEPLGVRAEEPLEIIARVALRPSSEP